MSKVLIAPSILSADFSRLGEEVKAVESSGADWIHIDVMDGHFVDNITMGPCVVKSIRPVTRLPIDVHLMVANPEKHVASFVKAGGDMITFHVEAGKDPEEIIRLIRYYGKKAGVSLRPKTDCARVAPILAMVDMVLVMTVEPGFGGQEFIFDCLPKIEEVRRIFKKSIQVDGGINEANAPEVIKSGANILVAGTSVFGSKNYAEAIKRLRG